MTPHSRSCRTSLIAVLGYIMLGGSGLGLHIVNQIVTRQLNGTITMQTGAQGTRFVMQFPRLARPLLDVVRILASRTGSPRH